MEANLIERVGEPGKKLHTGRSRNDQVALDMRLYTRAQVVSTDSLLKELMCVILDVMEANVETYMPGLPICRRRSPLLWLITTALTLRCLSGTGSG